MPLNIPNPADADTSRSKLPLTCFCVLTVLRLANADPETSNLHRHYPLPFAPRGVSILVSFLVGLFPLGLRKLLGKDKRDDVALT